MSFATLSKDVTGAARELVRLSKDPIMLIWGAYLLAVPIYIFKSGLPQPGDYLILLLVPLAFSGRKQRPVITVQVTRALLVFTVYVVSINLIWSAALGNWTFGAKEGFLLSPLFYIYNALMFLIVVQLYQRYREKLLWYTAKMLLVSLVLQALVSSFWVTRSLRTIGMFNNANQLGFFALLSASILLLLQRRKYSSTTEVVVGTVSAVYLCLLSASKAALGGIGLLVVFGLFVRLRTMLVIGTILVLSMVVASPMLDAVSNSISRIENDTNVHSEIEERGYDRIVNNPEYLVTGAGEGGYTRFEETTVIGSHEIHSSLGTLVFCYGVLGLVLFGVFIWLVLRGSGLRTWFLVAPSFAYSMTHQGLRSTLFWVQLAIVLAMSWEARDQKARERAARLAASAASAAKPAA
jgi:hypothetical protein